MDVENEIHSLAGETLALQTILGFLCYRLAATGPETAAIAGAFDDAADLIEIGALKFGKSASPQHSIHALRVVEELRTAALGNHKKS
jgi:hypothetical protein